MRTSDTKRTKAYGKEKAATAVLVAVWAVLAIFAWLKPPADLSLSERRTLRQFPEISLRTVYTGSYMNAFDEAATDQFPLRERFRSLRAETDRYVFQKKDVHQIYLANGYLAEMLYPTNEKSVRSAGAACRDLYQTYMKNTDVHVYLAVVPDKGHYLGAGCGYLTLDYTLMCEEMQKEFEEAQWIPIEETLSVEDYYATDSHWRQECLGDTAETILDAMGAKAFTDLERRTATTSFLGVYAGRSALPVKKEPIEYLTNADLEACQAYHVENGQTLGIYDTEKLQGRDPYDFFLSGASAIIEIENPNGDADRELVIFRDSFGSSLSPLLFRSYGRITLIDTRYINSDIISKYVEFQDQDVLFLYSTLLLNQSDKMRKESLCNR